MHPLTEQCSATSKRTGARCERLVIGGGVCRVHGGAAPQVVRKREERIELAEALAAEPRRHPAEVLLDSLHVADVMLRRSLQAGTATPDELAQLVEMLERAQRFAKVTLDVDLMSRHQQMQERIAGQFIGVFEGALDAAKLSRNQRAEAQRALMSGLERLIMAGETV